MSVITYHEVSNEKKDLFNRLSEEGVIHPGKIYSPRRHEYVMFNAVFDYTKCDKETLAELDARTAEHKELYREELANDKNLTDEMRAYEISENEKCDTHLMPVSRSNNGGVVWTLNYSRDDLPSVAIGRKYPEEVFEYLEAVEDSVVCHVKYKKDNDIENLLTNKPLDITDNSGNEMPVELDTSSICKKLDTKDKIHGLDSL